MPSLRSNVALIAVLGGLALVGMIVLAALGKPEPATLTYVLVALVSGLLGLATPAPPAGVTVASTSAAPVSQAAPAPASVPHSLP